MDEKNDDDINLSNLISQGVETHHDFYSSFTSHKADEAHLKANKEIHLICAIHSLAMNVEILSIILDQSTDKICAAIKYQPEP